MRATLRIGVVLVAAGSGLGAQDPLSAAKEMYASAAYEDALTTLGRLSGGTTTPDIARQVDEYRAFCLYALGRTREAESIAESMIRKEPLARLDAIDASPRLEVLFTDVRRRLLPSLIRERFRIARSALDQKSFSVAEPQLAEMRLMIAEAETLGVKDDGLGDMRVLVDGFLTLIRSAAEQRASPPAQSAEASVDTEVPPLAASPAPSSSLAPVAAELPVTPPPPSPDSDARSSSVSPAQVAADRPVPTPPARSADSRSFSASPVPVPAGGARVYSVDDEGVSPPVALEQRIPVMTTQMQLVTRAQRTAGVLDVVIDESGRVVDATIRQSLNSSFDSLIVRTARRWKYRPAMKDGVPVRFVKTLILVP